MQWAGALAASIDDIAGQAQRLIRQELETVEDVVADGGDRAADLRDALSRLAGTIG